MVIKEFRSRAEGEAYIKGYLQGLEDAIQTLKKTKREFEEYSFPELFVED